MSVSHVIGVLHSRLSFLFFDPVLKYLSVF